MSRLPAWQSARARGHTGRPCRRALAGLSSAGTRAVWLLGAVRTALEEDVALHEALRARVAVCGATSSASSARLAVGVLAILAFEGPAAARD